MWRTRWEPLVYRWLFSRDNDDDDDVAGVIKLEADGFWFCASRAHAPFTGAFEIFDNAGASEKLRRSTKSGPEDQRECRSSAGCEAPVGISSQHWQLAVPASRPRRAPCHPKVSLLALKILTTWHACNGNRRMRNHSFLLCSLELPPLKLRWKILTKIKTGRARRGQDSDLTLV